MRFTEEARLALRARREAHGLSRAALARVLGVRAGTVARWEDGPTVRCIGELEPCLRAFLAGKLDGRIARLRASGGVRARGVSGELRASVWRVVRLWHTLRPGSGRREELLRGLRGLTPR